MWSSPVVKVFTNNLYAFPLGDIRIQGLNVQSGEERSVTIKGSVFNKTNEIHTISDVCVSLFHKVFNEEINVSSNRLQNRATAGDNRSARWGLLVFMYFRQGVDNRDSRVGSVQIQILIFAEKTRVSPSGGKFLNL